MKQMSLTLPDELAQRLQTLARREHRSLSNLVVYLLGRSIDRHQLLRDLMSDEEGGTQS